MWSPEELGEDAGPEHPTRRDDVPGRAHQKIREVRPRRQAAHHAVGERGPRHTDPDESLEQPLPAEFAPARAVVGREVLTPYPPLPAGEGELTSFPLSGTERGTGGEDRDEALRQELCAAHRAVNPLARERIEEVGGVTHEHHRGDTLADRSEAHVTALAHVQLAHTVHPRDARHVRRESDAPRR